jgi:hypothetical protein
MQADQAIEDFLQPVSVKSFFDDHWEKGFCHFKRGDPGHYADLFSLAAVDSVLSLGLRGDGNALDLVKAGHPRPVKESYHRSGRPDIFQVYRAYGDGYTVVVNSVHLRSAKLSELCSFLRSAFRHPVSANLYLTPATSQGFGMHFDDHDVFILQLEGAKVWKLYSESPVSLPLLGTSKLRFKEIKEQEPQAVLDLNAGDMLYIPRGQVHEAFANDSFSLHLTVAVDVVRLVDVLVTALTALAEKDIRLRRALPTNPSNTDEELISQVEALLGTIDLKGEVGRAVWEIQQQQSKNGQPTPDGHFASLNLLKSVNTQTVLTHRSKLAHVSKSAEGVAIEFEGNRILGPTALEHVFQYIVNSDRFYVHQLPDLQDDLSKIQLIRKLITEGFLRVVQI